MSESPMQIDRYDEADCPCCHIPVGVEEMSDGTLVRYEDHRKEIERVRQVFAEIERVATAASTEFDVEVSKEWLIQTVQRALASTKDGA